MWLMLIVLQTQRLVTLTRLENRATRWFEAKGTDSFSRPCLQIIMYALDARRMADSF
jgi:hypothetical protein